MATTTFKPTVGGTVLFWFAIFPGCVGIASTLADIYMLATGSQPGDAIYLDELAPTPWEAARALLLSICWVVAVFLLRARYRRSRDRQVS